MKTQSTLRNILRSILPNKTNNAAQTRSIKEIKNGFVANILTFLDEFVIIDSFTRNMHLIGLAFFTLGVLLIYQSNAFIMPELGALLIIAGYLLFSIGTIIKKYMHYA